METTNTPARLAALYGDIDAGEQGYAGIRASVTNGAAWCAGRADGLPTGIGYTPKYLTADGCARPAQDFVLLDTENRALPVWGSNPAGADGRIAYPPVYELRFDSVKSMRAISFVADQAFGQGVLEGELKIDFTMTAANPDADGADKRCLRDPVITGSTAAYAFTSAEPLIDATLTLDKVYQASAVRLTIRKWSRPGTCARLTFFNTVREVGAYGNAILQLTRPSDKSKPCLAAMRKAYGQLPAAPQEYLRFRCYAKEDGTAEEFSVSPADISKNENILQIQFNQKGE